MANTHSAEGKKSSPKAQATTSALRKKAPSKSPAKSSVVEPKNLVEKIADLKGKTTLEASVEEPKVYYEDSSSDDEVINIDVCGIVVPFMKVHLAVISRLKIHGDTNVHIVKLGDNIRDKYFSSHKVMKREILYVVYSSIQAESDEYAVKLTLLYFLGQDLLSNAKSMNVPDICFRTTKEKKLTCEEIQKEIFPNPNCMITEIELSEKELSEMRTRGLIVVEKASLKRKLVLEKESEAPQDEDDKVSEVRNIHPSKC
ncbi:hypothetical protein PanWU01x14_122380 [Parasponia andersonii]|uniref:Uncharacterized protein n=1 Tax=Parasponia andersonii TaxID=3476 RepID=A0A2P5CUM6_PARAD|nr:hypothetical protein PanWU01x14_122380 [Parasponia andersonii]